MKRPAVPNRAETSPFLLRPSTAIIATSRSSRLPPIITGRERSLSSASRCRRLIVLDRAPQGNAPKVRRHLRWRHPLRRRTFDRKAEIDRSPFRKKNGARSMTRASMALTVSFLSARWSQSTRAPHRHGVRFRRAGMALQGSTISSIHKRGVNYSRSHHPLPNPHRSPSPLRYLRTSTATKRMPPRMKRSSRHIPWQRGSHSTRKSTPNPRASLSQRPTLRLSLHHKPNHRPASQETWSPLGSNM